MWEKFSTFTDKAKGFANDIINLENYSEDITN